MFPAPGLVSQWDLQLYGHCAAILRYRCREVRDHFWQSDQPLDIVSLLANTELSHPKWLTPQTMFIRGVAFQDLFCYNSFSGSVSTLKGVIT